MSVSLTHFLPDAVPAGSNVEFVPLGGNGITAPSSYYAVELVLAGDASGGDARIQLRGDPRFTHMPAYIVGQSQTPASDLDYEALIATTPADRFAQSGTMTRVDAGGVVRATIQIDCPPILMRPAPRTSGITEPWIRLLVDNPTAASDIRLYCRLYNFHVNVAQLTPLPILVANLPS